MNYIFCLFLFLILSNPILSPTKKLSSLEFTQKINSILEGLDVEASKKNNSNKEKLLKMFEEQGHSILPALEGLINQALYFLLVVQKAIQPDNELGIKFAEDASRYACRALIGLNLKKDTAEIFVKELTGEKVESRQERKQRDLRLFQEVKQLREALKSYKKPKTTQEETSAKDEEEIKAIRENCDKELKRLQEVEENCDKEVKRLQEVQRHNEEEIKEIRENRDKELKRLEEVRRHNEEEIKEIRENRDKELKRIQEAAKKQAFKKNILRFVGFSTGFSLVFICFKIYMQLPSKFRDLKAIASISENVNLQS